MKCKNKIKKKDQLMLIRIYRRYEMGFPPIGGHGIQKEQTAKAKFNMNHRHMSPFQTLPFSVNMEDQQEGCHR